MSSDFAPKDIYLGDITPDYTFNDELDRDRRVHLEQDFWRDETGQYLLFRRQRELDQLSNVVDGGKAQAGFFGHRLGGANKPSALRLASGHVDAVKFPHNVVYELDPEMSDQAVDLRHFGGEAPASAVALHGLTVAMGLPLGRRQFDSHPELKDRPIITDRTLTQKVFAPEWGRQAEDQPAAFMHVPYPGRLALRSIAHQTKQPNRR